MENDPLVETLACLVVLLFLAALSSIVTQRLRFPYTVGLVILGVAIAFVSNGFERVRPVLERFELAPAVIMFLFVPLLIFESAFNTNVRQLRRELVPTLILAGPGLLLSTALIGTLVALLTPLPLAAALVFGCLISATDPVAVIALFKEIGAPRRLTVLVEGESVFNDATAIVTFKIILTVATLGAFDAGILLDGVVEFFVVFFGGLFTGVVFGYLLVRFIPLIGDEPLVHITLTLVTAYAAFIVADHVLDTSGIMAVLGAGLVIGYYAPALYPKRVREYLEVSWENLAFLANSLIFLMLGLSEEVFLTSLGGDLSDLLVPVLVVIVIVLFARGALIYALVPAINMLPGVRPISARYKAVMAWGGLRGAVAVALAMSLPADFPFRKDIIDFTFAVTLFMLLVNATTVAWLMRSLGLDRPTPLAEFIDEHARVAGERAVLNEIATRRATVEAGGAASGDDGELDDAERRARSRLSSAKDQVAALRDRIGAGDPAARRDLMWLAAAILQHRVHLESFREGFISWQVQLDLEFQLRRRGRILSAHEDRGHFVRFARRVLVGRDRAIGWRGPGVHVETSKSRRATVEQDERARAIRAGAELVLARLDELALLAGAASQDVAECRAHHEGLARNAEAEIARIETEVPQIAKIVRRRHLDHIAAVASGNVVTEFDMSSEMALDIAEHLRLDGPIMIRNG